jgi:hypothetical protein
MTIIIVHLFSSRITLKFTEWTGDIFCCFVEVENKIYLQSMLAARIIFQRKQRNYCAPKFIPFVQPRNKCISLGTHVGEGVWGSTELDRGTGDYRESAGASQ